ncbi:MAG TPA: type II toxin-antitoxin system RelE/ParE family toxin [Candidatus Didemnitutus sp.]|nr:type II toxin-antitoxin system RelE/ParE family toxin [Candidatus Didemnitutus sp.]
MDITFAKKGLEQQANDLGLCIRKMGEKRAKIYQQRLGALRAARTLEDVRFMPGHFHELVEDRKGQWSCNLDQPYRLIFEPQEDPIPTNGDGSFIWNEIVAVRIVEVVDYHGG